MAQYYTDFSEYTIGDQPNDWTLHIGDGTYTVVAEPGATGGVVLETLSSGGGLDYFAWDLIDADADRADVEVLFKAKWLVSPSEYRALARGSSVGGQTGYMGGARQPADFDYGIAKLVSGSFKDLDKPLGGPDWLVGVYHLVRFRVVGGEQKLRIWADGDTEPAIWNASATDTSISAAGWVGIYKNRGGPERYDWFAVATNGETATPTPTLQELTNPTAQANGETAFTGTVSSASGSGTLDFVATESATKPAAAQVQAGQDNSGATAPSSGSQAITATGTQNVSGSGLTASTTYYVHYVQSDGGLDSAVVSSDAFTTDTPPAPPIPAPTNPVASNITDISATFSWARGV